MTAEENPVPGPRRVDGNDPELRMRHAELLARDRLVGLEATVETLERELAAERRRVRRLRRRLAARDAGPAAGPVRRWARRVCVAARRVTRPRP